MIKIILALSIAFILNADTKYVGDDKSSMYYNNPKLVDKISKNYGLKDELVVYYVKIGQDGKSHLSNEIKCCSQVSLSSSGSTRCIKLQTIKNKLED